MRATLRPLLVALASTGVLTAALPLCADPLLQTRARVVAGSAWADLPLDLVLASLAAAALGLCGLWVTVVTLAATAEALTGRSWGPARAITPRLVHRGVLALCGLAVGGVGVAVPATAAPPDSSPTADRATATLDGLPVPDRVEGGAPSATSPLPSARRRAAAVAEVRSTGDTRTLSATAESPTWAAHRVVPGDSLWSIAATLHPAAKPSEIDLCWRRIYRANRSAVGSNPHLLLPGTTLRLPEPSTTADGADGPRRPVIPPHRKDAS